MTRIDINSPKRAFFVGIKGVGMTAVAQCLIDLGWQISGADTTEDFVTQRILDRLPITLQPLEAELPKDIDLVVYTTAHGGNQQLLVKTAVERGLPVLSHAQMLGLLADQKSTVAVCGVGGKSTVSAMLSFIFEQNMLPVSYQVGVGQILGLDRTGRYDPKSKWFVTEADEYANDTQVDSKQSMVPRFAFIHPTGIICTQIQFDHPDVYRDLEHTQAVFLDFFRQIRPNGFLIYNAQDNHAQTIVAQLKRERPDVTCWSFGLHQQADWQITDFQAANRGVTAKLILQKASYTISLKLPGQYNVRNAVCAMMAATRIGVPAENAIEALSQFQSTKRRCELVKQQNGITFFDDYAHHPSELQAVIQAFQEMVGADRLLVVFQPHTFSRTKELFNDFVTALAPIPRLILLEIFPSAREKIDPTISCQVLAEAINRLNSDHQVQVVPNIQQLAKLISQSAKPGDIVLTLGAGDIYLVHQQL